MVNDMIGVHVEQAGLPSRDKFDEPTDTNQSVHPQSNAVGVGQQI